MRTLEAWFSCDLYGVYSAGLSDPFLLRFSNKAKPYGECLNNYLRERSSNRTANRKALLRCLTMLRTACLSSKYRIIKTIRANLRTSVEAMMSSPSFKIIHLIRDPRPTFISRKRLGGCRENPGGDAGCAMEHCDRVMMDTRLMDKLRTVDKLFNTFLTITYEQVALDPVTMSKRMYDFVGMYFSDSISEYVHTITLGGNRTGCTVCSQRWQGAHENTTSLDHVYSWKSSMPPVFINLVQSLCTDVIKYYNYEIVNVTTLKP